MIIFSFSHFHFKAFFRKVHDYVVITVHPFPNKPWFLCVCCSSLLKTLWKKEKLLIMSNFTFSHSVFYPFGGLSVIFMEFKFVVGKLFQFGRVKNLLFGKGLICRMVILFTNSFFLFQK